MYYFNRTLVLTSGVHAIVPGDLFFGDLPTRLVFTTLSGVSNDFSTIQFVEGSFKDRGSLIVGGATPSGIVQILDLETNQVSSVVEPPVLKSQNITDVTD